MCGFTCDLIDFDELTAEQKKTLMDNLQQKKRTLQTQIRDINTSLKGIDRCMKKMTTKKKSKRRG